MPTCRSFHLNWIHWRWLQLLFRIRIADKQIPNKVYQLFCTKLTQRKFMYNNSA